MHVTHALTSVLLLLTLTSGSGWGEGEEDNNDGKRGGEGGGAGAGSVTDLEGHPPEEAPGEELLCDTARLQCTLRTGCGMALTNFFEGCGSVLTGAEQEEGEGEGEEEGEGGGRCPTACRHALVSLLSTEDGAGRAFMHCDCRGEGSCRQRKRRVQVCQRQVLSSLQQVRQRGSRLSCWLARWLCEADTSCLAALRYYVQHCAQLFAGTRCTSRCRNSVMILYRQPRAHKLRTCRCQGDEDYDCPRLLHDTERMCLQRHRHHPHHAQNRDHDSHLNHSHSHYPEEFDEGVAVYRQPGRPPAAPVSPQSHTSGQTSGLEGRSAGPKAVHRGPFRRRQRRNKPGSRRRARQRPRQRSDPALSKARRERGVLKRRRGGFGRKGQAGGRRCRGRKEGGRKKRGSGRRGRAGRRARLCRSKKASAKRRAAQLRKRKGRTGSWERGKRSDAGPTTRSPSPEQHG